MVYVWAPRLYLTMKINPYSWLREVKKKMNFVFPLIGEYIVSIDLSCLTSNTFAKLYDSDHIICADKAAPLKQCRIKVKSYSSALTVFPFSRSKVSQLFMRGYPVRMWMDDQVMLFSHEAGDMACRSWSLNGELVLQYFLPEKQQIRKQCGYNNPNQINLQHAKSWRYVLDIMTGLWRSIRGRFLLFILRKASIKLFWVQQSLVTCSKTKRGLKNIL